MYYKLLIDLIELIKIYDNESDTKTENVQNFSQWLNNYYGNSSTNTEPEWNGKAKGRSADSVINTSLVHLYRYAKLHAKTAIINTDFSTPDDFIYLISLQAFGSMTKTSLIKLNVHEKSAGIQIVNRLINNGLVEQATVDTDKRNRMINITSKGIQQLNESMDNIRSASNKVTEPLTHQEKMDLIRILSKLENFHEEKYKKEL